MENIRILLNFSPSARSTRVIRRQVIQFCDSLLLFLACGYDLSYAWKETFHAVAREELSFLRQWMCLTDSEGLSGRLRYLTSHFPHPDFRQWFAILEGAYGTGSPVIPIVKAFSDTLRREQARDFEEHCRNLPTRTNILLLLFFLPPALLVIFAPLMISFGKMVQ